MASYTTNLNLKKPAGSENVAIGDINNNMDVIDQAYGALSDQIAKQTIAISGVTSDHTIDTNSSLISKIAGIVYDRLSITLTSNVAAFGTIATLPTAARPNVQFVGFAFDSSYNPVPFDITYNGAVRVWKALSSGQNVTIASVYFAQ